MVSPAYENNLVLTWFREHLYRRHQRFKCNRCYKLFKEHKELEKHQRSKTPCPLREVEPPMDPSEGFTEAQSKLLKSRKQGKRADVNKKTEVERWYDMYCILFCLDPTSPELPSSPCKWSLP